MQLLGGWIAGPVVLVMLGGLVGTAVAQDEETWPRHETGYFYGQDDPEKQTIEVILPAPREAPQPALVWFHGGALQFGSTEDVVAPATVYANKGYVGFLPGYRLYNSGSGANAWPTQLDDAQRAVRWIRAHADEFNVDPDRICAIGHSAGGYLAALLGTMDTRDDSDPELVGNSSRVDCVVMLAGDGDPTVPAPDEWTNQIFAGYYGGTLEEHPELYEAASPTHHVDGLTVPFLVAHGSDDERTSVESARHLVEAMESAGREVKYLELPTDHVGITLLDETLEAIDAFLADRLDPEE